MSLFREMSDRELADWRVRLVEFADGDIWRLLRAWFTAERERVLTDIADKRTTAENLKFAQGELSTTSRDIMLVDDLLRSLSSEQQRRQRVMERTQCDSFDSSTARPR